MHWPGIVHRWTRCSQYKQTQRLAFDAEVLDAWFSARSILDWAHRAHHVIQHTQPQPQSRSHHRIPASSIAKRPSIYHRCGGGHSTPGIPVQNPDGGVDHYEDEWTLPHGVCV